MDPQSVSVPVPKAHIFLKSFLIILGFIVVGAGAYIAGGLNPVLAPEQTVTAEQKPDTSLSLLSTGTPQAVWYDASGKVVIGSSDVSTTSKKLILLPGIKNLLISQFLSQTGVLYFSITSNPLYIYPVNRESNGYGPPIAAFFSYSPVTGKVSSLFSSSQLPAGSNYLFIRAISPTDALFALQPHGCVECDGGPGHTLIWNNKEDRAVDIGYAYDFAFTGPESFEYHVTDFSACDGLGCEGKPGIQKQETWASVYKK